MFEALLRKVKEGYGIYDACEFFGLSEANYRKLPKSEREELVKARKEFNRTKNKTHTQGDPENFIRKAF